MPPKNVERMKWHVDFLIIILSSPVDMNASEGIDTPPVPVAGPSKPRKRFVGTSKPKAKAVPIRRVANQIPDDILNDPDLNAAIAGER